MIGYNHTPVSYFTTIISMTLLMLVATYAILFPEKVHDAWVAVGLLVVIWFGSVLMWISHLTQHRNALNGDDNK